MYYVSTKFAYGVGVTKEQAVAGICAYLVEEDFVSNGKREITVIEFDADDFYGDPNATFFNPEEQDWPNDKTTITVEPDGIRRFAELHNALKRQLSITQSDGGDWRIDYGDDDITYVTRSESGAVVSINEHWDRAKEAREEANEWEDGEEYWIDEVEEELNLTLEPVD